jgi:L-iditol 2-dehydrogenase
LKSAVLYGPEKIKIEDVMKPSAGPEEVIVKVDTALTCGTDVKVFLRGGHPRMINPPAAFGHEFSGVIAEIGGNVCGFKKGMRVAAANSAPCGECFYCRKSLENLCDDLIFINGAYSEYIKIPERIVKINLFKIPDELSFEAAALIEPLACVLHGAEELGIKPGDTVVVNGAGPIGLLFIQVFKFSGARVVSTDTNEKRRKLAIRSGADAVVDPGVSSALKHIQKFTEGRGADGAVDATGIPKVWEDSVGLVRKGGAVVFFGGCAPGSTAVIDTALVHYSELTLKGVFHHRPRFVKQAFDLLARGAVSASNVVTREMPLSELPRALNLMINKDAVKIAIKP